MAYSIFWWLAKLCAQLLVLWYPGVWFFWFVFHTRIARWRKIGKRAYWYACAGWPAIGLPLLYFRREIFQIRWSMPWFCFALAGAALVLAIRFGLLAGRIISRRTIIGLVELEPQKNPQPLMQTGVYAKTRNPLYFTHWLLILAAAALTGYAANWALFVLESLLLPLMIRAEEKELIARYGAPFLEYQRRVPRFFPNSPW